MLHIYAAVVQLLLHKCLIHLTPLALRSNCLCSRQIIITSAQIHITALDFFSSIDCGVNLINELCFFEVLALGLTVTLF